MNIWSLFLLMAICTLGGTVRYYFFSGYPLKKAFIISAACSVLFIPLFMIFDIFTLSRTVAYILIGVMVLFLVWLDYKLDKTFPKRQD